MFTISFSIDPSLHMCLLYLLRLQVQGYVTFFNTSYNKCSSYCFVTINVKVRNCIAIFQIAYNESSIKYLHYENESHCNDYSYGVSISIRDPDNASHTVCLCRPFNRISSQNRL